MSRDLSLCCSRVRAAVPQIQADYAAQGAGLELRPIQTSRTLAEQQAKYAEGRTMPGPGVDVEHPLGHRVTNADGVNTLSNHQPQKKHDETASHACDLGAFLGVLYVTDEKSYEVLKILAPKYGLRSGWTFVHAPPDGDHVEC